MTKGMTIVALTMASVASLAQAATAPSPLIAQAKRIIAAEMVDPHSLQYRLVRVVHRTVEGKPLSIVCGEFNAHNRMGGYMGYAKFAYEPTVLHGIISMKPEGGMDLFGDAGADRSDAATESSARILAVCLGVSQ